MKKIRFFKSERAQSITEFALVLPVMILILTIIVEVSALVDTKILLQSAACDSSRLVTNISENTQQQAEQVFRDYHDRLDIKNLEVSVAVQAPEVKRFTHHAPSGGKFKEVPSNYKYCYVTVTLKYKKELIMPLTQVLFGKFFNFETKFSSEVFIESYNPKNNTN